MGFFPYVLKKLEKLAREGETVNLLEGKLWFKYLLVCLMCSKMFSWMLMNRTEWVNLRMNLCKGFSINRSYPSWLQLHNRNAYLFEYCLWSKKIRITGSKLQMKSGSPCSTFPPNLGPTLVCKKKSRIFQGWDSQGEKGAHPPQKKYHHTTQSEAFWMSRFFMKRSCWTSALLYSQQTRRTGMAV